VYALDEEVFMNTNLFVDIFMHKIARVQYDYEKKPGAWVSLTHSFRESQSQK
jgi:hypothetical protein